MAYEILTRQPLHNPYDNTSFGYVQDHIGKLLAAIGSTLLPSGSPPQSGPTAMPELSTNTVEATTWPVVYNFQHDLESLWWIALWVLLARIAHEASQQYARTIYVNRLGCPQERAHVFVNKGRLVEKLRETMHSSLRGFINLLDEWRVAFLGFYTSRETGDKLGDLQTYSGPYLRAMYSLGACYATALRMQDHPSLVDIHRQPLLVAETLGPTEGGIPSATALSTVKQLCSVGAGKADAVEDDSLG